MLVLVKKAGDAEGWLAGPLILTRTCAPCEWFDCRLTCVQGSSELEDMS